MMLFRCLSHSEKDILDISLCPEGDILDISLPLLPKERYLRYLSNPERDTLDRSLSNSERDTKYIYI